MVARSLNGSSRTVTPFPQGSRCSGCTPSEPDPGRPRSESPVRTTSPDHTSEAERPKHNVRSTTSEPRGDHDMTTTTPQHRATLNTPAGAAHARIWGVGGYRPER